MMDVWTFLPLAILMALTPGPNNFCALHHGIRFGVLAALIGTTGRVLAFAIFLLISGAGLGAMLLASETAFTLVKWAGAAYLIYLGIQAWRQAGRARGDAGDDDRVAARASVDSGQPSPGGGLVVRTDGVGGGGRGQMPWWPWWPWVTQEFWVGISNPKAIVLFAAVFPQFLDPSQPTTPQFLALGATYLASEFVASAVYAVGGLQIRRLMTSPRGARRVGQATGGVFVGAGALLLTAQR